jgi:uncharacterized protein (TIGR03083 family)
MVDRVDVVSALDAALGRFVALLRALPQAEAAVPVPNCPGWTVADTAAHVLTVLHRALTDRRRSATPADTAALNATCLAETAERNLTALAALIERDGKAAVHGGLARLPLDLRFPFHAGATTTVVPAACILLCDVLVHGHDIAEARGREWPIPQSEAALALRGGAELLAAWRRADAPDHAVEIVLPGGDPVVIGTGPLAHRVTGLDAGAVLLAFPYRRIATADPGLLALQAAHHSV